ncbi:hypothetical protein GSF70_10630 [Flavobacteriaceae bacterium W22]|nr:hypothetical protein [Flavobacteriaceae bacterium W22]
MKNKFLILIILLLVSCQDKKEIFSADREAPLGWIYLKIYNDESFEFISRGMMGESDVYSGKYKMMNDTIDFKYENKIPAAGSKAVIRDGFLYYLNGEYPETLNIKLNQLKTKNDEQ